MDVNEHKVNFEAAFPLSQAGRAQGLTVVLDAHNDLISSSSVSDDFRGFYTVVDSKEQVNIIHKIDITYIYNPK